MLISYQILLRVLIPPAPNNEWCQLYSIHFFFDRQVLTLTPHNSRYDSRMIQGHPKFQLNLDAQGLDLLQAVHYAFKSQSGLLNLSLEFLLSLPWKPLKLET